MLRHSESKQLAQHLSHLGAVCQSLAVTVVILFSSVASLYGASYSQSNYSAIATTPFNHDYGLGPAVDVRSGLSGSLTSVQIALHFTGSGTVPGSMRVYDMTDGGVSFATSASVSSWVFDAPMTFQFSNAPPFNASHTYEFALSVIGDFNLLFWRGCSGDCDTNLGRLNNSLSNTPAFPLGVRSTLTGPDEVQPYIVINSVSVAPPTFSSVSAIPETIDAGQASTLSWTTANAASVAISGISGTQVPNGSLSVSPAATSTYTLTATGAGGTGTATATVTVNVPVLQGSCSMKDATHADFSSNAVAFPTSFTDGSCGSDHTGQFDLRRWDAFAGHYPSGALLAQGTFGHASFDSSSSSLNFSNFDMSALGTTDGNYHVLFYYYESTEGSGCASTWTLWRQIYVNFVRAGGVWTVGTVTCNTFTGNPSTISFGQSSTLSWTTTNAASVTISGVGGTQPVNGSASVSPTVTTTYTLTATGAGGTAMRSTTITVSAVAPPTIVSFAASPTTITLGQSSTLSWTSTNTTSVAISGVNGAQPVSGSVAVSPTATSTYMLTATGPGGTATATTTITVSQSPVPVILSFTANPDAITPGQSSSLNWTTANATAVGISGIALTQPPVSGSVSVSPTTTTTYTLTASGPGGTVTAAATVVVTPALATCLHTEWDDLQQPTSDAGRQLESYFGNIPPGHATLYRPMIDEALDSRVQAVALQLNQKQISITRVSGYRPADYQTHLHRLSVLFRAIYDAQKADPNVAATCAQQIGNVMTEVSHHGLTHKTVNGVPLAGELLVGKTSRHSALPANALDVSISPTSGLGALNAALPANGLYAPCHETSIHLQTVKTCPATSTTVTASAFAPVGVGKFAISSVTPVPLRLLLRDPAGRRVGYDTATGAVINEIGARASYSGIDSDPQVVTIDEADDGDYRVEAVAAFSGEYTLALTADDTEDGTNVATASQSGHVLTGEHLNPISIGMRNTVPQPPSRTRAVKH
jgi:hypothetical protein